MEQILFAGLTSLLLLTPATFMGAEVTSGLSQVATKQIFRLTPSQLVDAAYRGQIEGIPGYRRFIRADYRPRELVQLAIDSGSLPPDTLDDPRYLNSVRVHLRSFRPNRFGRD
ncbi:MAG: hypothetical protein AAF921_25545 [Cyanobacteria bacterium P01_D01_bin.44]